MGIAILDLNWTAERFWRHTPHEFQSALDQAWFRTDEGKKYLKEQKFARFKAQLEATGVA